MSDTPPKYRLKVTAGPSYDTSTHQIVPVNEDQSLRIENEHAIVSLCVRIRDYTGYPDTSPKTTPYFNHPLHTTDQYSISFAIVFKHPVNGNALLFGNDFDRPIRDRLPPGFNAALRFVKWFIDPTLDGDAYADRPFLYSPGLAAWNLFCIGEKVPSEGGFVPSVHDTVVEEGGEGSGGAIREGMGVPGDVVGRRRYFQDEDVRGRFEFEEGRVYWVDFGNSYLGFNDFSLHLPGITVNALQYVDEENHSLRYVLRDRDGEPYFVVLFTLVLESFRREDGRFEWEPEPEPGDVE
ncbi:hypothetical protein BDV25DRAFT_129491 [Aspergillus avenaceus]|uniref:Domain of unknown function at the cortex 1 domain-containing protein n=1 Tax=Aspergillus avenaceus TaxID=36643 RepID=A0A5N6TWR7_ASPAV|nr:hypothetical protein BDV25DRAFT_129491 [Aspergillus avenaceus]